MRVDSKIKWVMASRKKGYDFNWRLLYHHAACILQEVYKKWKNEQCGKYDKNEWFSYFLIWKLPYTTWHRGHGCINFSNLKYKEYMRCKKILRTVVWIQQEIFFKEGRSIKNGESSMMKYVKSKSQETKRCIKCWWDREGWVMILCQWPDKYITAKKGAKMSVRN